MSGLYGVDWSFSLCGCYSCVSVAGHSVGQLRGRLPGRPGRCSRLDSHLHLQPGLRAPCVHKLHTLSHGSTDARHTQVRRHWSAVFKHSTWVAVILNTIFTVAYWNRFSKPFMHRPLNETSWRYFKFKARLHVWSRRQIAQQTSTTSNVYDNVQIVPACVMSPTNVQSISIRQPIGRLLEVTWHNCIS